MPRQKKRAKSKVSNNKENEQVKGLFVRLVIILITGILFYFWNMLICVVFIINFIIAIFVRRPNKVLVDFSKVWVDELYRALRYALFISDERPFPFKELKDNLK